MSSQTTRIAFICSRCLTKQQRRLQSTQSSASPPLPASGASKLTNRRLIHLQGADAPKFLQGIITNNVRLESAKPVYAAFLTAPGKVLHDVFVYPTLGSHWQKQQSKNDEPGYMVEVDAEQADVLFKHLRRHKLRSKLQMRMLDQGELNVWSVWREGERWTAHGQAESQKLPAGTLSMSDCRAPGMGQRVLIAENATPEVLGEVEEAPLEAYTIRRYLRGIPEGQREIPRDDCLPMNYNLDIMGGIDFKKGCYIGQELTIRTHHTGVVRRRVLPVALYPYGDEPPDQLSYEQSQSYNSATLANADIRRDDQRKRSTGKLITSIGNVGLGLCRLENMSDLSISGEGGTFTPQDRFVVDAAETRIGVKAFVPDWMRGRIREPRVQRRVE